VLFGVFINLTNSIRGFVDLLGRCSTPVLAGPEPPN
jgi:hypothetical protein